MLRTVELKLGDLTFLTSDLTADLLSFPYVFVWSVCLSSPVVHFHGQLKPRFPSVRTRLEKEMLCQGDVINHTVAHQYKCPYYFHCDQQNLTVSVHLSISCHSLCNCSEVL